jgi:hypothetical protein
MVLVLVIVWCAHVASNSTSTDGKCQMKCIVNHAMPVSEDVFLSNADEYDFDRQVTPTSETQ